ncbi:nuclear transport factor 2 family protein [Rhizobium sp. KVB221]|uniref:Nuclear transport factor 2 family protein n=1 Tax=Rhizobium setariae TaxID=2801340 RepID=A0A936YLP1_9HYPH|nr:nuclear transport factor 2 family protein [Rhizobium setariae]MBL0370459.1 nuclear transport factor 2 family protein [Rhizobium setariae]
MLYDPIHIAQSSYLAYVNKDRAALEALIADDFHFTSPLDNRLDRETYFERCWPNSASICGFDFIHTVAHGDKVYVTYVGRTTHGSQFRNTEILTIHEGRIVEAEVYFGWNVPHEAAEGGYIDAGE